MCFKFLALGTGTKRNKPCDPSVSRNEGTPENLIDAYSNLVYIYGTRESPLKDLPKALLHNEEASRLSADRSLTVDLDHNAVEALSGMGRYEEASQLCAKTLRILQQLIRTAMGVRVP